MGANASAADEDDEDNAADADDVPFWMAPFMLLPPSGVAF